MSRKYKLYPTSRYIIAGDGETSHYTRSQVIGLIKLK